MCGQTVRRITSVMSQCHADLRGLGGKYVCGSAFSDSFHFSHLVVSCSTPLYPKFKTSATSAHLLYATCSCHHIFSQISLHIYFLCSFLPTFLYLLHRFYILNHQKLTFKFYIYKLNIYIFSFSCSRATRRLVILNLEP